MLTVLYLFLGREIYLFLIGSLVDCYLPHSLFAARYVPFATASFAQQFSISLKMAPIQDSGNQEIIDSQEFCTLFKENFEKETGSKLM